MKERPILFSAAMVRALLEGRKTMTRRIVKDTKKVKLLVPDHGLKRHLTHIIQWWRNEPYTRYWRCPYGQLGDRLWVKETWSLPSVFDSLKPSHPSLGPRAKASVRYIADGRRSGKTRVSIHMPRWASRILLEITDVRVEKLQEISEAGAIAEGIENVGGAASCSPWRNYRIGKRGEMHQHCSAPTRSYMTLWESINGPGSWDANPWVFVIEFRRVVG